MVATLPETNSSHLKMDGWNTHFLLGWPICSGATLVFVDLKEPSTSTSPSYRRNLSRILDAVANLLMSATQTLYIPRVVVKTVGAYHNMVVSLTGLLQDIGWGWMFHL